MKRKQKQKVTWKNRCRSRSMAVGVVLLGVSGLTGCSSVPDAINPAEWYNSTVDFFAGEDDAGQVADQALPDEMQENPGADKAFPNLVDVPERPKRTTRIVQGGLVADTQGRTYAQAIPRQGESASSLSAANTAPTQPPPPAMPVPSVVAVQPPLTAAPAPMSEPMKMPEMPQMASQTAPSGMPANAEINMNDDPFATVVVSSNGVEMQSSDALDAPETFAAPSPLETSINEAPQLAVAPVSGERVATILFSNGSNALTERDRQILKEIVSLHRQRGGRVRIVGHASSRTRNMDPVRHKMVNYKVSVDRAEVIGNQLMRLGLASVDVVLDARSDTVPLFYESMPSGEAGNRRAEIYFVN